ncbi:MAB_1171c family putative transporter [Streptomyces wuyuanensis]|uniref:MAB_1171c family putative transporter n=1 Tax=Streptomyces wuyuanensis TaxID=1196353 RepID=UPI0037F41D94
MMNLIFLGMAVVLLLAALYWARRRRGPRPAGTWAMCALLTAFALAFVSYAPALTTAMETVVPHVARLFSNSFTLAAATSVLAFLFQMNLEPDEARRRIRRRLVFLVTAVSAMVMFFALEQWNDGSPQMYALYMLIYISYLGVTVRDFLQQTWTQAKSARRRSQRIGLRITVAGCLLAMLYIAYKVVKVAPLSIGMQLVAERPRCSSPVTPATCAFSVTAPALAVLLITIGLTLPAAMWPIRQLLRHRWEARSVEALKELWSEMSRATPEIVLPTEAGRDETDFLLHRRVIEINDGILALRPYRSVAVQQAATEAVAALDGNASPSTRAAIVEAAVLSSAVLAKTSGGQACSVQAPPAPGTNTRADDLWAETEWLLQVARAYADSDIVRAVTGTRIPTQALWKA